MPTELAAFWGALVLGSLVCIMFFDQPVALFFSREQGLRRIFQAIATPSLLPLPLAGLYLAWMVLQKLRGQVSPNQVFFAMSLATLAATAAKDELKWIFGRSWPQFWLHDGIYGFKPFTDSYFYGGFPSGHTAYISAPLGVLFALQPRFRLICGAVIGLVMFGLVAADYHYLADVLGGLVTGTACAWGTLVLLRRA